MGPDSQPQDVVHAEKPRLFASEEFCGDQGAGDVAIAIARAASLVAEVLTGLLPSYKDEPHRAGGLLLSETIDNGRASLALAHAGGAVYTGESSQRRKVPVKMLDADTPDVKSAVRQLADTLPNDATWDDVMYRIYVHQAVDAGLRDAAEGRLVGVAEVRRQFGLME